MTSVPPEFAPLRLKKHEDRRIRQGHPWVYSNEVDIHATPLKAFTAGQAVELQDARGVVLGTGYVNPHSLICARIVSRDPRHPFAPSLLVHRLKVALALRERLYPTPHYRLVHGEGDGLPGLVVDRYGDAVVVQTTTAGMEVRLDAIVEALNKVVHPELIVLRNEGPLRALEGLESETRVLQGVVPEALEIDEYGVRFQAPLLDGQKTGWFYDQRDNRRELARLAPGARVLDVFSYVGGWGIQAARHGAREVLCVDQSTRAGEWLRRNADANGFGLVEFQAGEAFASLKTLREASRQFDLVIVDPPAFIKRRKDYDAGVEAYRRVNQQAMQVLARDGLLIACSCSYHLPREALVQQLHAAARHLDRNLQILGFGQQSADHPLHPMIPETAYLKVVFARITA
ncbi:MAG: class I SAM-dependent rRNA methyltransferase [Thiotrichales bacterium]